jgi:Na+/H+ antiporter NhaD/arsenite permease-like protein
MTIALTIFALTYLLIATEKFPRQAVALLGGTLMIMFGVFDIKEALGFVDWETMGLLFGMFILVAILAEAGFFTWLAIEIAAKLQYRPSLIFIFFPLLAAFMAAFMDSITVMLFLSALTLRISRLTKLDPVPLIIAEVCAANTGGAATLVGDPPNVILGTTLGFGFNDFLIHNGPVVFFCGIGNCRCLLPDQSPDDPDCRSTNQFSRIGRNRPCRFDYQHKNGANWWHWVCGCHFFCWLHISNFRIGCTLIFRLRLRH